jgi:hypothetical protein
MAKQFLLLILLTVAAMFFKAQIDDVLNFTVNVHDHFIRLLAIVFSNDGMGRMVQAILALLLIPAIIALIISGVYWLRKKSFSPYTMHIIWISWLVLLTTFTLKGV